MQIDELKKMVENVEKGEIKTLKASDKFQYKCASCGRCCHNVDVMMNIYDLVRLRNALKLPTHKIIDKGFLCFYLGASSGLPISAINFLQIDPELNRCPFLIPAINFSKMKKKLNLKIKNKKEMKIFLEKYKENSKLLLKNLEGVEIDKWICKIYKHRPIICRLYPLGRIKEELKDSSYREKFILQNKNDWCSGWKSKHEYILKSFLDECDFWHFKEGSDKFHGIMNLLITSGFFASTKDNKKSKIKPLFEKDSPILMFIGNLFYNFDSINYFSQDKKVIKTIYENVDHSDFMYVVEKVNFIVNYFIKLFIKQNIKEEDYNLFIDGFLKKGVKVNV